jgi:hypothetical protein
LLRRCHTTVTHDRQLAPEERDIHANVSCLRGGALGLCRVRMQQESGCGTE